MTARRPRQRPEQLGVLDDALLELRAPHEVTILEGGLDVFVPPLDEGGTLDVFNLDMGAVALEPRPDSDGERAHAATAGAGAGGGAVIWSSAT